jgi:hypothetical protein
MGTSRNDRSPATPPWKAAWAVLGAPDVPAARQSMEIWRAALADRGDAMLRDFSSESLREACRLASSGLSPQEAVARFNEITRYESNAGLAIDMGRRAVARCAAEHGSAVQFVAELFSEAVSYYASRDLPSYVAAGGRISSSSEAIQLKNSLREVTKKQVESVGEPRLGPRRWPEYVARILSVLQTGGIPE